MLEALQNRRHAWQAPINHIGKASKQPIIRTLRNSYGRCAPAIAGAMGREARGSRHGNFLRRVGNTRRCMDEQRGRDVRSPRGLLIPRPALLRR